MQQPPSLAFNCKNALRGPEKNEFREVFARKDEDLQDNNVQQFHNMRNSDL